jgi:DMSO/TMAO reductase YedYZ molybdopterin-dependent catalytic subunit
MKYVRKSNIIEAIQWTGKNLKEVIDLIGLHQSAKKWTWEEYEEVVKTDGLKIFREFGYSEFVSIGDWITKNSIGIVYSYGDDYFKETYQSTQGGNK